MAEQVQTVQELMAAAQQAAGTLQETIPQLESAIPKDAGGVPAFIRLWLVPTLNSLHTLTQFLAMQLHETQRAAAMAQHTAQQAAHQVGIDVLAQNFAMLLDAIDDSGIVVEDTPLADALEGIQSTFAVYFNLEIGDAADDEGDDESAGDDDDDDEGLIAAVAEPEQVVDPVPGPELVVDVTPASEPEPAAEAPASAE